MRATSSSYRGLLSIMESRSRGAEEGEEMESEAEKFRESVKGRGGDLPTTGPATRAGRLLQLGKDLCTKQAVAEAQLQVEMSAAMAVEIFAEMH
jgi:hypothetical protein